MSLNPCLTTLLWYNWGIEGIYMAKDSQYYKDKETNLRLKYAEYVGILPYFVKDFL